VKEATSSLLVVDLKSCERHSFHDDVVVVAVVAAVAAVAAVGAVMAVRKDADEVEAWTEDEAEIISS
jgi:hypothetical protein